MIANSFYFKVFFYAQSKNNTSHIYNSIILIAESLIFFKV